MGRKALAPEGAVGAGSRRERINPEPMAFTAPMMAPRKGQAGPQGTPLWASPTSPFTSTPTEPQPAQLQVPAWVPPGEAWEPENAAAGIFLKADISLSVAT